MTGTRWNKKPDLEFLTLFLLLVPLSIENFRVYAEKMPFLTEAPAGGPYFTGLSSSKKIVFRP